MLNYDKRQCEFLELYMLASKNFFPLFDHPKATTDLQQYQTKSGDQVNPSSKIASKISGASTVKFLMRLT